MSGDKEQSRDFIAGATDQGMLDDIEVDISEAGGIRYCYAQSRCRTQIEERNGRGLANRKRVSVLVRTVR